MTKYLSLFSGIGAFECAVKDDPSFECVGYSEVDPDALKVYKHWYSGHTSLGDVRALTDAAVKDLKPDLIVAGFPCTDLSSCKAFVTKKERRGLRGGGRSALFVELVRIIQACLEVNPRLDILVENVASMKRCHRVYITSVLQHVLPKRVHQNVVCASHFSVQRRKRLFWTTWPLKDETKYATSTATDGPFFRDIADHDTTDFVHKSDPGKMNNLIKTKRTFTIPFPVEADIPVAVKGSDGWYFLETKTFSIGKGALPRTRFSMAWKNVHTNQAKSRTITTEVNSSYIRHVHCENTDLFKFRFLTARELHACFGFPYAYCKCIVTRSRLQKVLGNSIVVGVIKYILTAYI